MDIIKSFLRMMVVKIWNRSAREDVEGFKYKLAKTWSEWFRQG